jgi:hypothetical protein
MHAIARNPTVVIVTTVAVAAGALLPWTTAGGAAPRLLPLAIAVAVGAAANYRPMDRLNGWVAAVAGGYLLWSVLETYRYVRHAEAATQGVFSPAVAVHPALGLYVSGVAALGLLLAGLGVLRADAPGTEATATVG